MVDVHWSFMGSSGGTKRQKNRKLGTTSGLVSLTHVPSGIALAVTIPEGSYSKNEFRELKLRAQESLLAELSKRLRKHK